MPQQPGAVAASSSVSGESDSSSDDDLVFYPAYCYRVSPTWFKWVKLTAFDIHHHLRPRRDLQAVPSFAETSKIWPQYQTLLLFYLNHPIQFIQLVGVVVAYEDYFDKFWLFTIDDSSGATIEINCRKPEQPANSHDGGTEHNDSMKEEREARNNVVKRLDIGSVVQVKGQITVFRNTRQIQLERVLIVQDTNHEIQLIAARVDFFRKVLSIPWELSSAKQKYLHRQAIGENESQSDRNLKRRKYEQLQQGREKRHSERVARQYEREEHKRRQGAEDARNGGQIVKGEGMGQSG